MRTLAPRLAAAALLLPLAAAPARAQADVPCDRCSLPSPMERVARVADEYVRDAVARFPEMGEQVGDSTLPDRWTDNAPEAIRAWEARQDGWLARLDAVDPASLEGTPEWLVHGVLREALESARAQRVCRAELWTGIDQIFGWHLELGTAAARQPMGSDAARAAAGRRWRALPAFVETEVANAREGLARGYAVPRATVERVIGQVEGMLPDSVEASPFWSVAARDSASGFGDEWRQVVSGDVYPALRRWRDFLRDEYLPRARAGAGLGEMPEGAACYRALLRAYTSLDLAPEELSARGREARRAMEAELQPIARRLTGQAELRAARRVLATDPRFAFGSREAKLEETRAAVDEIRRALPRAFSRVPETPVVVQPAAGYTEASSPPAWYQPAPLDGSRPGTFYVNLGGAETSPRMGLAASVTHEAWPGHHLQIAWLRERPVPHPVMRLLRTDAFVEGWGMYAERLAYETGMLQDELMRAGLLAHLLDALVGLEVDPGIHLHGWTREAATDSMMAISGRPRAEAERYADRHSATPVQMATYMAGYLEIVRLREEAHAALGERWDLRAFHDVVLDDGPVPFALLREKVARWVDSVRAEPD